MCCAVWRGSKVAKQATLTQRVLKISSWTSPSFKSIFSSSHINLIEKRPGNRVIKPSIVLIDKAFKGRLVVPDFNSFKKDISELFSRFSKNQNNIENRL